jgi:hypothetical protein
MPRELCHWDAGRHRQCLKEKRGNEMNVAGKTRRVCLLGFAFMLLAVSGTASGAILPFGMEIVYSGTVSPGGPPPWLTATFDDHDSAGSVTLTLTASNLVTGEFAHEWYFNLDPSMDLDSLAIVQISKTGSFDNPTVTKDEDALKADGDGQFDILFDFANSDGADARFTADDSVQFTLSGIGTLTVDSFDFTSVDHGLTGLYSAAHIQGIADGCGTTSDWVTCPEPVKVPEPATLSLLALGGLALLRRKSGYGG